MPPVSVAEADTVGALGDLKPELSASVARTRRAHRSLLDAQCRLRAVMTFPAKASGTRGGLRLTQGSDPTTWEHHVRYAKLRCPASRRVLLDAYRRYAEALARRFYRGGEPLDDLKQVAMEALLLALERFDPDRRVPFVSFMTPTIVGTIKRFYRDQGWAVRVPRRVHDLYGPARQTADRLTIELGRVPTPAEVAEALDVDEDLVLEALEVGSARAATSLDAARVSGEPGMSGDRDLRRAEDQIALQQALRHLPASDRELIRLYYEEELTQSQIAEIRGVSQMQISRLLGRAVRRLRGVLPAV